MLKRVFALHIEDVRSKDHQIDLVCACTERLIPSRRRKEIRESYLSVGRKYYSALEHEKNVPAYVRACDAFLQKMAADPVLQPPAEQP